MIFNISLKESFLVVSLSAFSLLFLNQSYAQDGVLAVSPVDRSSGLAGRNEFAGTYIISAATAGTHDFISNASFLGFGLDWGHYINDRASVGFSLRWNRFYQEDDRATYDVENATITGKQYKSINMLPLFPRAKLDLVAGQSNIVPYVQIGLGPMYGQKYRSIGNYNYNDFGWQFGFAPEVGIALRSVYGSTGALFSVRYDAGLGSDAFPAYSAFNFSIGFRQVL